jgi:phospholipid/cholesterol/gamma-HCH transport system permease protein
MGRPHPVVAVVEATGEATGRFGHLILRGIGNLLGTLGELFEMTFQILLLFRLVFTRRGWTLARTQIMDLGVASLPLIFITALFIGMVAAVSAKYQFQNFVPLRYLGTAVTQMVFLELGPVLTALVMSGRIGSSIAAQIGTMKEKEEVDAYRVLDLDPLRYLAMPRVFAGVVMLPTLTIIACSLALFGSWAVAVGALGVTSFTMIGGMRLFFRNYILLVCVVKGTVFGGLIAILGYYNGIKSAGGARGVGEATMKSVVSSSVMILMFDFLITFLMLL